MKNENQYKFLLDDTNQIIHVSDIDSFEILYANNTARDYSNHGAENIDGYKCHKYMMGLDRQCPFCPLRGLKEGQESLTTEMDTGNKVFAVKLKRVNWGGREAFVEYRTDITVARRAQELYNESVNKIISAVSEAMGIFYVNLTRNTCIRIHGTKELVGALKDAGSYQRLTDILSETVVGDKARQRYCTEFDRENLLRLYGESKLEKVMDIQCHVPESGIHWVRVTVQMMHNPETDDIEAVMYGMDVDDILKRQEENNHLIRMLSSAYISMHYINLTENTFKEFKAPDSISRLIGPSGNAVEALEQVIGTFVSPNFSDRLRQFTDLKTLTGRLKNSLYLAQNFVTKDGRWYRAVYIKALQDENGGAACVFFALQDIDEMVRQEQTQRLQDDVITALSRDYFVIYYMNLDEDTFAVLRSREVKSSDIYNVLKTARCCSEAFTQYCSAHVHEDDRQHFLEATDIGYIRKRLETEDSFAFRYRARQSDGEIQYFEVRIVRGEAEGDSVDAVMGIRSVDAEVKKELEYQEKLANAYTQVRHNLSQEEQYRQAIVSEAILVYNVNISQDLLEDNIYVMLDNKPISVLGLVGLEAPCRASEFFSRFASDGVQEEYKSAFAEGNNIGNLKAAFERGENEQVIEFAVYFSGRTMILRQTMLLFRDLDTNDIIGLCNCKDITKTRQKELESQRALKDALDAATLANQAKTDFLSRMSHDIRTPMNAIIGMTAIAGAHIDDTERVKDSLAKISASSRHLLGIINDILDMSKIESGKASLNEEDFNLSELLTNLFDMIRPQVRERRHELKVHIHDIKHEDVVGDSLRIQQVFVNIMSNAIKYTPQGGIITVSVSEKLIPKTGTACYEFIFEDNGIGMPQEFLDRIFEPFERVEDLRTSKIQGTGLGMAITKNIVNMMGGQIQIESEVGKGSKFTVTIFLKLRDSVEMDTAVLAGLPVLVADDDKIDCENTSIILQDIGMDSEWVLSGQEAVERVKARSQAGEDYFAVILDWKMPGMGGVETTRQIRSVVGDKVPIIIISAYDWSDIEEEARRAGANAFIGKPAFKSNFTKLFLGLVQKEENDRQKEISEAGGFDFRGIRVLLAEDNDLNREIAVELLSQTGMLLEEAENGKEAVDMFERAPEGYYDMILMDIQMPVMNGYDATVAIRALGRADSGRIPIIAMTANAFAEDVHAAMSAGMNEHIAKPLDLNLLLDCIRRWTKPGAENT